MNQYRVMNREEPDAMKRFWEGEASSPEKACELAGFPPERCWIRVYNEAYYDASKDSRHSGGGWKQAPGYPREVK